MTIHFHHCHRRRCQCCCYRCHQMIVYRTRTMCSPRTDDDDYSQTLMHINIATSMTTATTTTAKVHYGTIGQLKDIICNCPSFLCFLSATPPHCHILSTNVSYQKGIACNTTVSTFYMESKQRNETHRQRRYSLTYYTFRLSIRLILGNW